MSLKPWRDVIAPHQDVREGKFVEAEFAADLTKVVKGTATAEYQNPDTFFERTVVTEGMSLLLQSVVRRLTGEGGDPVVQLQTAFGGGKTHTMMAVYHVATSKQPASELMGVGTILKQVGASDLPKGKVAVLDGNALSPSQPRDDKGVTRNTLWGELAFQLAGKEGYDLVAGSDQDGTSPGKEVLGKLFEKCAPCVVLMDETVAYLRQLEPTKSYKGGTFNSNLSFIQALTEAASATPKTMVLASLPESMMEVGDQHGQDALEAVQKYFGRIEAVWKPVATEEAFEIVRRRLFGLVDDEGAVEATCRAFVDLYQKDKDKYPSDARDGTYYERLKASYPIHPEVFDRLYEVWSTLPKFQRTRGVLRLMAHVIHALWTGENHDLMIMPGSIPLMQSGVRSEFIKYLPAGWDPVVEKDIDGPTSLPGRIDADKPHLGGIQAARRAARTIFLGSAPNVAAQNVRGIETERVLLGCVQPEESAGKYGDALKHLSDQLHYLYTGNDRYWYDLRPNLRREMETRRSRFNDQTDVVPEVKRRLEKLIKRGAFSAVHVFPNHSDVPDKPDLRLVVLDPFKGHKRKDMKTDAVRAAQEMLDKHGEKAREYKNRVLFLAPSRDAFGTLISSVRAYLAWDSICKDADELNLDKHHEKEAKNSRGEADARVDGAVKEAYKHLLVPMQEPNPKGGLSDVFWEEGTISTASYSFAEAIEKAAVDNEWVIKGWAPVHLKNVLSRWFWKDDKAAISANKVWEDTCRYLYLPRLVSSEVFVETVKNGVTDEDFFGYAQGEKDGGGYVGLLFGKSGAIYLDDSSVLIEPAAAKAAAEPAVVEVPAGGGGSTDAPPVQAPSGGGGGATTSGPSAPEAPAAAKKVRFHASVNIDVSDPIKHFGDIVQNVVEHFSAQFGTGVSLTVDIGAQRDEGFDSGLQRIVKENCSTLKFSHAEFEEE